MKRSVVVSIMLGLAVASTAFAQMSSGNVLPLPTLGVRGGIDIARERLSPNTGVTRNSLTYGAAGVNYEFSVLKPMSQPSMGLSLRTDLMYLRSGGKFVSSGVTEKDKVDQLQLAPTLVYRFTSQTFVPFVQAGPYGGIDLNHKYTLSGSSNGVNVSGSGDIPNWRDGEFGLDAGLGFKIPTPAGAFSLDGRYSWGLINKFKSSSNNNGGNGSGIKRHNDGLLIMAGYDFNFMGNRY